MKICPNPTPYPHYFYLITGPAILISHWLLKKQKGAVTSNDMLFQMEHLYRLLKMGAITEEEFRAMKEKLKEQI